MAVESLKGASLKVLCGQGGRGWAIDGAPMLRLIGSNAVIPRVIIGRRIVVFRVLEIFFVIQNADAAACEKESMNADGDGVNEIG